MKIRTSMLLAGALLFAGCQSEDPAGDGHDHGHGHDHTGFTFTVWPESGSTVFADTALYVGDPLRADHVHGTIAVIVGGDAPAVGAPAPDGAQKFAAAAVHGDVVLPTGEQTVHVVLFGEDGKATDQRQTLTYTVEATPAELGVEWLEPADGATVKSPFTAKFGIRGVAISPAGANALDKTVGHHHVTIGKGAVTPGVMVPMDDTANYLHYGKGQESADLTLSPGTYELTMQFADAAHRSYGPRMSKTIRVTVE